MIVVQNIVKQPEEALHYVFELGQAIASVTSIGAIVRELVAGSADLVVSASVVDGAATAEISGGTDGERYLVTLRAVPFSDEDGVVEAELEVAVVDGKWTMPDGGVAYLSISDFVDSFGLEEVVRMTDNGSGRIDRAMLVGALRHAQGIVDINLGGRYAVPLATVPDAIKTAIADIARARLYPRGAPDGVADAAKVAHRMLERISTGSLPLSIPAGEQPASAESDAPIMFTPGRKAYPGGRGSSW
ncbi:DUF1320 domain-containing protein [Sphingomonas sp. SRS2]|uniref:DUF1320 domain-containing protein n=1 Tax=Sphingomonas sp. SRS2 TaxID=133190 RepID=UPI0006183EDD|nr:DUF1320 domain-containing protein [Sphingomonas sp. SRS2]KKC27438.1 hypothetical protein WP12_03420 [Sphingomonas sp. SRS2]